MAPDLWSGFLAAIYLPSTSAPMVLSVVCFLTETRAKSPFVKSGEDKDAQQKISHTRRPHVRRLCSSAVDILRVHRIDFCSSSKIPCINIDTTRNSPHFYFL